MDINMLREFLDSQRFDSVNRPYRFSGLFPDDPVALDNNIKVLNILGREIKSNWDTLDAETRTLIMEYFSSTNKKFALEMLVSIPKMARTRKWEKGYSIFAIGKSWQEADALIQTKEEYIEYQKGVKDNG